MKIKAFLLAIGFSLCLITQSAMAGTLEDAYSAASRGDYAAARDIFLPLAEQGNSEAQAALGVMYYIGKGIPRDFAAAAKWYRKAAAQDNLNAQYMLGTMYVSGNGVAKDLAEAARLFRTSAEQVIPTPSTSSGICIIVAPAFQRI